MIFEKWCETLFCEFWRSVTLRANFLIQRSSEILNIFAYIWRLYADRIFFLHASINSLIWNGTENRFEIQKSFEFDVRFNWYCEKNVFLSIFWKFQKCSRNIKFVFLSLFLIKTDNILIIFGKTNSWLHYDKIRRMSGYITHIISRIYAATNSDQ